MPLEGKKKPEGVSSSSRTRQRYSEMRAHTQRYQHMHRADGLQLALPSTTRTLLSTPPNGHLRITFAASKGEQIQNTGLYLLWLRVYRLWRFGRAARVDATATRTDGLCDRG